MNARWLLIALFLLAPTVRAGAFDARHVPAGAPWILHVDLEALSRSTILRALHADGVKLENEFDLDDIETTFGLSPFDDLRSLTFYGIGKRGSESVCVAIGTPALSDAYSKLAATKGARTVRVGEIDALQMQYRSGTRFVALLPGQPGEPRTAVVAPSESALSAALSVLRSEAPTLAGPSSAQSAHGSGVRAPAPMRVRPNRGSLVLAASAPVAQFDHNGTFLQRALGLLCEFSSQSKEGEDAFLHGTRAFEFELAETHDEVQFSMAIDAHGPAKAKELEAILRGSVTNASVPTDSPEVAARATKLIGALRFETLGGRLKASYRYSATAWVEDLHFIEEARGLRRKN